MTSYQGVKVLADFYGKMAGVADKLLTKFNQATIQLVRITPGTGSSFDPGSGTSTPETLTGAVARGIATKYILRGLAVEGDLMVTTKANGVAEPTLKDAILINGLRFKIVSVQKTPASGTPVVYKLIVRR